MSASLLVRLLSNTHPDATKDRRGAHKAGEIIVRPLGGPFGSEERPPLFGRVDLIGTFDAEKLKARYEVPEYDTADGLPDGSAQVYRRRLWRLDLALLSAAQLQTFRTATFLVGGGGLAWTTFRGFLRNQRTLATDTVAEAVLS